MIPDSVKSVSINRVLPDNVPLLYSDNFLVQFQDGMFILSFLQNKYPFAITPEEVQAIEQIDAYCVAQILLTPQQLERCIQAMQENFQKFVETVNQLLAEQNKE